jgi:hypothetical protein
MSENPILSDSISAEPTDRILIGRGIGEGIGGFVVAVVYLR